MGQICTKDAVLTLGKNELSESRDIVRTEPIVRCSRCQWKLTNSEKKMVDLNGDVLHTWCFLARNKPPLDPNS